MEPMNRELVITCEHAGNEVPPEYRHVFRLGPEVLNTHRGYDIGALELTNTISKTLDTKAYLHKVSRLIIDLNRSLHNPSAFSEYMDDVSHETRRSIIEEYYLPHRQKVQRLITGLISKGKPVLHLSVHTFTPQLKEVVRKADIGFLYDPRRTSEKKFCWEWRRQLQKQMPELKYRMNYPYRGTMDGFTTYLRKKFSEDAYMSFEVEVNQKFAESGDRQKWRTIQKEIASSLKEVINKSNA